VHFRARVVGDFRKCRLQRWISAETAGNAQPPTPDYEVRIKGGAGTRGQVYSASVFASKMGPDGKAREWAGMVSGALSWLPRNSSLPALYPVNQSVTVAFESPAIRDPSVSHSRLSSLKINR
jgi:hypothetical protein